MDYFQALRLRALVAVLKPDREYFLRRVFRWYSKTFSTPLHQVEELPIEDVLQAWYEDKYESMDENAIAQERHELLLTDEQRAAMALAEDEIDAESFEVGKIIAAEERAKKLQENKTKQDKLAETAPKPGPIVLREMPETDLPSGPKNLAEIPPDITMSFVDPDEFEKELDGFGSMTQPPK